VTRENEVNAHAALGEKISTREHAVAVRESALETREHKFIEQEQAATVRAAALEDNKFDAVTSARHAERIKLEERHAVTEARWLNEIDRARQTAKETAKEQQRQGKELRAKISHLQKQRDEPDLKSGGRSS
jgi:hypothetical protein